ncbi:MAG: DegT/DnrJ/EryC1/StrS family aminotransferase [Opitutales bacterium]|nr:DegT/DnrJ/EryC1/StrS family aminotransferase [Opitutales bacterium]
MTHKPPVYPARDPAALEAAAKRLAEADWTRLEGAPETERALEAFHGGGHAWFIASGTASLEALLLGHGIGPGDEVISTPYTWGATISAILAVGAVPVFADIDPLSGQLDPATVEACVSPRTRAIMTVHLFGLVSDVRALQAIAQRRGLRLFEDGSQAHGARLDGKRVGLFGDGGAFSCMGMKLLAGTEGGYALFADSAACENAKLYGQHPRGLAPDQVERLSADGLLDTLQLGWRPCCVSAELVRVKLASLDAENDARRRNVAALRAALRGVEGIRLPEEIDGAEGCWHLLSVVLDPDKGPAREEFQRKLRETGAGGFVYIPTPVHRMKRLNPHGYDGPRVFWHEQILRAGIDYRETRCPQAEWRSRHSVEFPFNWTEDNREAMRQLADCLAWAAGR